VREHLLGAVRFWIEAFDIDGLRLDAEDELRPDFMDELAARCKEAKPGFWLMGEAVHGDYRHWAREGRLDSVTNYELYKGLWSSFNDRNFFELSWTLKRQSGGNGMYRDLRLYNFVDNHDVNRLAGTLKKGAHLFPLYGLLLTLPGIPSIYYGSEFGLRGERKDGGDYALRPAWKAELGHYPPENRPTVDGGALFAAIRDFIAIRKQNTALRDGNYREVFLDHEQFAFLRECTPDTVENSNTTSGSNSTMSSNTVLVAVNSAEAPRTITIPRNVLEPGNSGGNGPARWRDLLSGAEFEAGTGGLSIPLDPSWLRILERG
jgi:glycosidase